MRLITDYINIVSMTKKEDFITMELDQFTASFDFVVGNENPYLSYIIADMEPIDLTQFGMIGRYENELFLVQGTGKPWLDKTLSLGHVEPEVEYVLVEAHDVEATDINGDAVNGLALISFSNMPDGIVLSVLVQGDA